MIQTHPSPQQLRRPFRARPIRAPTYPSLEATEKPFCGATRGGNCAPARSSSSHAILIFFFLIMTFFPSLLTFGKDPYACDLKLSRSGHPARRGSEYDNNGCDVYTRTICRARHQSWSVCSRPRLRHAGGRFRRVIARLLRRLGRFDPFAAPTSSSRSPAARWHPELELIPSRTAQTSTAGGEGCAGVGNLGWTSMTRIMRSSVIQVRNADFRDRRPPGGQTADHPQT